MKILRTNRNYIVTLGILLLANPALSVEYFADTGSGNDSNNCTTPLSACKTISAAMTKAATSGDTLHIGAGIYSTSIYVDKSIKVIGAGADKTFVTSPAYGFWINLTPGNVEIRDLSIKDSAHNGIEISSTGVEIDIIDVRVIKSGRGGIFVNNGEINLLNVEISENAQTGVHINGGGSGKIVNTTISGNNTNNSTSYAGIRAAAGTEITLNNASIIDNKFRNMELYRKLRISNTVIHNHVGLSNCAMNDTVTSLGHNLSGDATCSFTHANDTTNTDPKLKQTLAFNNGLTRTHALKSGSPLLNSGDNATCTTTDQRGVTRPQNGVCDIGAFEHQDDGMMFPIKTKQGKTAIIAL